MKKIKFFIPILLIILLSIAIIGISKQEEIKNINIQPQEKNAYAIKIGMANNSITEEKLSDSNCTYEINLDGQAMVTQYFGDKDSVVIADEIDGYKIESINTDIFTNSENLEIIKIPASIDKNIEEIDNFERSSILSDDEYIVYTTTKDYNEEYLEYITLSKEEKAQKEVVPTKFLVPINHIYSEKMQALYPSVTASSIPSSYDLRDHITVEVENQSSLGICYAYAALTSIETNMALNGLGIKNFSDVHAAVMSEQGKSGNFDDLYRKYLKKGIGPVEEGLSNSAWFCNRELLEYYAKNYPANNPIALKIYTYCTEANGLTDSDLENVKSSIDSYMAMDYEERQRYYVWDFVSFAYINGDKKKDSSKDKDFKRN